LPGVSKGRFGIDFHRHILDGKEKGDHKEQGEQRGADDEKFSECHFSVVRILLGKTLMPLN